MATPRLEIDLEKIAHNARTLKDLYESSGISVIGVTKVVCGNPIVAQTLVDNGINILGDSRIENIRRMRSAGIRAQFLLLRTPMLSQAETVVKYADYSHNTELKVIERLSKFAIDRDTPHKVILMVELGDLREGLLPSDLESTIERVLDLKGVALAGIGTNLACYGSVVPDDEKMGELSAIANDIEKNYNLTLDFVSGGNSANHDWFMSTKNVGRVNNLRLGESIFLGCDPLNRKPIPDLYTDAMTLVAEVIECKIKPSRPYGEIAQDAFGNVLEVQDTGPMRRALLGIGKQDVLVSGLTPRSGIEILGGSSDHIIVNAKQVDLETGCELKFDLNYGALLSAMTAPYVIKTTSDRVDAQEYCEIVEQN